jgi:hypothetical protein
VRVCARTYEGALVAQLGANESIAFKQQADSQLLGGIVRMKIFSRINLENFLQ